MHPASFPESLLYLWVQFIGLLWLAASSPFVFCRTELIHSHINCVAVGKCHNMTSVEVNKLVWFLNQWGLLSLHTRTSRAIGRKGLEKALRHSGSWLSRWHKVRTWLFGSPQRTRAVHRRWTHWILSKVFITQAKSGLTRSERKLWNSMPRNAWHVCGSSILVFCPATRVSSSISILK